MEQIPDAPWIRDAELNGMPDWEPVRCPVCGEIAQTIYLDDGCLNVIGCNCCVREMDADDWYQEELENSRIEE